MKTKLLLINSFIFIVLSLQGQVENYEYFPVFFKKSDMEYLQKGKLLNDSIYFIEERIKDIKTNELDSMPKLIIDIFIERTQLKANFYYLGYILVNLNFETYIFMIDYDWLSHHIFRKCYMINIQGERLLSIFEISHYMSGWSSSTHFFTKFQPPDILISEHKTEVYDMDYENEEDRAIEREGEINIYHITEEGFIIPYK